MKKLTPMMRQYLEIKEQYKNALLMFRLGDFYELFGEDALEASGILGITLTARNKGKENEVPMCGVPYHAAENYIAKLTRAGKNVAICDQLTTPAMAGEKSEKNIVERGVVRVITPGTTLNDSVLDARGNNYIVSISEDKDKKFFGLAICDVTTGEFGVTKIKGEKLREELVRLQAAEVVLQENSEIADSLYDGELNINYFSTYKDLKESITGHFGVKNLEGFGMEKEELIIEAGGLLIEYLKHTQKTDLAHIKSLRKYSTEDCMVLDETTIRNLELIFTLRDGARDGSVLNVIDKTSTAMGSRLLKAWLLRPLQRKECIEKRLQGVREIFENMTLRSEFQGILKQISDVERLLARISLNSCGPRDIDSLCDSLKKIPSLQEWLSETQSEILRTISETLGNHDELIQQIETTLKNEDLPQLMKSGGVIADGVNAELDELRMISKDSKKILNDIAEREIKRTGIGSLKVKFNNVFGYYIEISNANKHLVPEDYIRKQTLVNAERYITPELKEIEEKILGAEERITVLEKELFEILRQRVIEDVATIQKTAYSISALDVLTSFAALAKEKNYCCPEILENGPIEIKDGRHPVIENLTFENSFVPNDTFLSHDENYVMLITGPNMAGKSTYLRQVALITLLGHIGSFVPASRACIPLTDRIFTRVGASDNLAKGQSTFMVEMQEAANILNNATDRSLIILDEIGRGTSTYDGVSIAWAILEYVHDKLKAKTLFATHYHELIAVADKLENACNWSVQVAELETDKKGEQKIVFLHKVTPGGVDRSYGIEVARLAGLPREVVIRSKSIMKNLEEGVVEKGIQNALKKDRVPESQQDLFTPPTETAKVPEHLERTQRALDDIDPMNLTPMEALQKLEELKHLQENQN
ncbi:DNA mismatch repair protein MutS [Candidatus Peregrinibacteria bacterium]|nr:DNA mismatch repair protein MutS [Candidatus Peregrinibacteria bacterium]